MHFVASGSGSIPIVCVHGWGCDGAQFSVLATALAADFRVFCLDLPGHGSTPLGSFSPGWENYAQGIVDFILRHDLDSPVLLGHSMGGVLALLAAASNRIKPGVVINLDGSLPPSEKTLAGQALIRSWLDEPDFRKRFAEMLREIFFLPGERDSRCEAIIRSMSSAPEAVLRFLPEQIGDLHANQSLPKIKIPVLYVGTAAPRFDLTQARALLPQLEYSEIPSAGHFLHVYAPETVQTLVKAFLKQSRLIP